MNSQPPVDPGMGVQPGDMHESGRFEEGPRVVSSEALFGGRREIAIEHAGALYRLKITRQGKLILNK